MKLLRTIRLDPSDTFVFDKAAEPGEWAVSGAFMFWNTTRRRSKARRARRSAAAFSASSLGWSTLVQIVEASDDDRLAAVDVLAKHLVADFGAPTFADAVAAAEEEVAFAESLCSQPQDTLVAVHRTSQTARCARPSAPCARARGKSRRARSPSSRSRARTSSREAVDLVGMAERERK